VIAICVVTEHTLDQAEPLLDIAEDSGFLVHFQPQCVDTELVRGNVARSVPHNRWREFWLEVLEAKRHGRPVASSHAYLESLTRWPDFSVSAVSDPQARCAAGRGYLYVDPQGIAYPCAYTKGKVQGVDLLAADWVEAWSRSTPCTRCVVGPMLEFNLLFQRPLRSGWDHFRTSLRPSFAGRGVRRAVPAHG
jgi:MoaA/NifB/PqqE/SkfB family radical SAM enzyme